jgi:SAM-dependent methyltransferase
MAGTVGAFAEVEQGTRANSAVQAYWDSQPCGSREPATWKVPAQFFKAHVESWSGQRVLEIGVGMGADFIRFAKAKARICGIDISQRSLGLARQNAEVNGIAPILLSADGESLPLPDESFDLVYSWGVLHHTADIERALREIHRVLRPHGECRLMLYHRRSLVGLQCYLRYGLAKLRPFARLTQLIAMNVESPGTKGYTVHEVKSLFGRFSAVEVKPVVTAYDLRLGRRRFAPRWMLRLIPDRFGWFLLIRGKK